MVRCFHMPKSLNALRLEYSQLLEAQNQNLREQNEILSRGKKIAGKGCVYIVKQVDTTNYKIGITTNYDQRKYQFDVRLPFAIEEVLCYETPFFKQIEKEIHELLAEHRLNGSEFFSLTSDQLDDVIETIPALHEKIKLETEERKVQAEKLREEKKLAAEQDDEVAETIEEETDEERTDPLLDLARAFVFELGKASTSLLQRKFMIGYSRAARLMDALEEEEFISPQDGNKPRKVIGSL